MLLVIGLALKNTCEKHDCFLARYGSNEFAILIKAGDVEKAQEVGEALRLAVEQSQTEHKYSQVSKVVTLSIGISSVYPISMTSLMMKSEKALFSAKTSGCNRVCSDSKLNTSSSGNAPVIEPKEALAPKEPEKSEFELLLSDMNIITRRELNAHFCNVWKKTLDDSDSLSMIICELDFFADYREHHGEQTNDDILLIVGSTLQNKCAEFNGSISYLAGNKFVALIKGGNVSLGLKAATEFQSSIENLAITNTFSPVKYCLTMSLGLANVFPSDTQSMKGLMNSADSTLKLAQSSGYDQVQRV